jgi:YD repeat-containing protein
VLRNRVSTGEVLEFEYDLVQGISRVTDNSGRVQSWYFDSDDRLIAETDAEGGHTVYELDRYGNRVRTIDPLGRVTRQRFDIDSHLIEIELADGGRWQIAYSAQRQPVAITDPTGAVTRHVYDARGNLVETVQPDGASTRFVLNSHGLPEQLIDALGGVYRFGFDAAGRLTERTDCLGQPTRFEYDGAGNLVRVIDALGGATQYRYQRINRRDRVVGITLPDGQNERFAYDTLGRLIAHHDALGRATAWQLDAEGRPLARVNALGHRLTYQYDRHGRLLSLTNENGAPYRFAWDRADRLLAEQGFDGRRLDYRYNAAGELIETADGASPGAPWMAPGATGLVRTRLQRDAMGRLSDRICLLGRDRSQHTRSRFEYDPAGRLIRARNTAARVELVYSPRGLLAAEISRSRGGVEQRIEHTYDALGHRISTTLPDGRVLHVDRYGSGHVHRLRLDGDLLSEFERDGLHRETVRSQGALRSFFEHDPVGRLTSSRVRLGDAPTGASATPRPEPDIRRNYHYDAAGQLLRIDDRRSGVQVFRYDATNRLIAAQGPLGRELFAFDPASNLLDADK